MRKYHLKMISFRHGSLVLIVLAVTWLVVIKSLWSDWMIDPQYGYGLLVPFLVLGLLWRRLQDLPHPGRPSKNITWLADGMAFFATVILTCIIPMSEANPDWRILGVLASCAAVIISFDIVFMLGGWTWLKHLIFPIGFFLIAVPWPRNFERAVMNIFVAWNADASIEILHWLGYQAVRQGNLILLPVGVLGMEEACSGIRSFQAGLMVSLFVSEYFRLKLFPRLLLLSVALLGALLGNIIRSSLLAVIASLHGLSSLVSWHDPAGFLVLVITVTLVVCAGLLMKAKSGPLNSPCADAMKYSVRTSRFHLFFLSFIVTILLISCGGTEYWFREHERALGISVEWDLHPRSSPSVVPVSIPSDTLKMLYDPVGFSEKWRRKGGEEGQAFYFRWPKGRIAVASILAMHSPEVCLPNLGMILKSELPHVSVNIQGISLQFHSWLFEENGRSVYVFNAAPLNFELPSETLEAMDDSPLGRFKILLSGLRNRGQRMVEVAFWNLPDENAAKNALTVYLNEAIVTPSSRGSGKNTENR